MAPRLIQNNTDNGNNNSVVMMLMIYSELLSENAEGTSIPILFFFWRRVLQLCLMINTVPH